MTALKKKSWIFGGCLILVIALIGLIWRYFPNSSLKGSTAIVMALPSVDKEELLIYSLADPQKDTAELYIQKSGSDKDKVASDVLINQASMLYYRHAVLFLDKSNDLYLKETGKDKEKVSSNVIKDSVVVSKDESAITFLGSETTQAAYPLNYGDLYIAVKGKEKDKIASNVALKQYAISTDGRVTAFITQDHNLYIKQSDKQDKEKIASDAASFTLSDNGKTIAVINKDNNISYKSLSDKDKTSIPSSNAGNVKTSKDGSTIAFLNEYKADSKKGELYGVTLGKDKQKIASDITDYTISDDGRAIYFVTQEQTLYSAKIPAVKKGDKNPPEITKEKIASDVKSFKVSSTATNILYINKDDALYVKQQGKDSVKLADNIVITDLYENTAVYLDKERNLAKVTLAGDKPNIQKIASDVQGFQHDGQLNRLAFSTTKGQVSIKIKDADAQTVIDNANAFRQIYYNNALFYEKKVQLSEIKGVWKPINSNYYVEITDSAYNVYDETGKGENQFTVTDATPNSITLTTDKNYEFGKMPVKVTDKDTLVFSIRDWGETSFKRTTQEELNVLLDRQKKAAEAAVQEAERKKKAAEVTAALEAERAKMGADKEAAQAGVYEQANTQGKVMVGQAYQLLDKMDVYSSPSYSSLLGTMAKGTTITITDYRVMNLSLWVYGKSDKYTGTFWFRGDDVMQQQAVIITR